MRRDNAIVDSYLNGVETRTSSPYLLPANPLFPDPSSALVMEIPVGHVCCAIACSPCGQYIAVGGGRDVVVADVSKGEILKCLAGHAGVITSLSFADGSKKIVSGSWDKSVAMWEWETLGLPVQVFKGHSDWVTGVAVNSDASKIFSCADDGTVRIWNANTGAQIEEFAQQCGVNCLAISNDHRCVAICLLNGTLKVLESCTGDTILEDSDAHEEVIISVAFSAKGQRLATGSRDKTIRVWDTATWTRIGEAFQGHTCIVYCVTFRPDGQHIASGSVDCTVRLWETNTGSCIWVSPNASSWVKCVAFSRDVERIFSGSEDGNLRIWDTRVAAEGTEPECGHSAWVEAVAISHDGLRVASGSKDRKVCLWNSRVGNQIGRPLEGHADSVKCVSFSHDGRLVVSGSLDKTVRMWDAEKLRQIGDPLEGHSDSVCCVSFSSDGLRILSGSWDTTIRIWDVKSGKQVGNALEGHTSSVEAVSESGDGCYVVSRDYDDAVIIWNRSTRTIAWQSQRLGDSETAESSERGSAPRYEVMNEEAMNIIQSCGDETPHLWPKFFPMCTVEVYCRNKSVYANIPTDATLLGTLPSYVSDWKYNKTRRVFVAGMESGAVAICNLIVRDA